MKSADLERLQRWEDNGADWGVVSLRTTAATIALLRCDGGEEVDRFTTTDPRVLARCRERRG
ncbi:hypothetical protein [Gordonia sp. (in: high G+C Gram-positive bacteria)]|uniref:hypothetical protein n=1 Tax=Gordonia sp. (in: high G+C Gram-positive bacteria) TaxID=84139 RepID=UPI0016A93DA3|nr:hypothetical protein [Gordonia sp. (in: high G+C Gram-positive bacteria)]NLG46614.1 hypothetical protein [Gordonia sp. (in: high G+C Gram-positive bacteria)]